MQERIEGTCNDDHQHVMVVPVMGVVVLDVGVVAAHTNRDACSLL